MAAFTAQPVDEAANMLQNLKLKDGSKGEDSSQTDSSNDGDRYASHVESVAAIEEPITSTSEATSLKNGAFTEVYPTPASYAPQEYVYDYQGHGDWQDYSQYNIGVHPPVMYNDGGPVMYLPPGYNLFSPPYAQFGGDGWYYTPAGYQYPVPVQGIAPGVPYMMPGVVAGDYGGDVCPFYQQAAVFPHFSATGEPLYGGEAASFCQPMLQCLSPPVMMAADAPGYLGDVGPACSVPFLMTSRTYSPIVDYPSGFIHMPAQNPTIPEKKFGYDSDGKGNGSAWLEKRPGKQSPRVLSQPISPRPDVPVYVQKQVQSTALTSNETSTKFSGSGGERVNLLRSRINGYTQGFEHSKPKLGLFFPPSMNMNFDVLNEQVRGPRAFKVVSNVSQDGTLKGSDGHYNKPEFATSYEDARFFVIKSYSEDDVHKSIKYGVWTSTAKGNKRLDVAYQQARAKVTSKPGLHYPIFLFFSVNGSGQFCGVAEMTGPVDFIKSMGFWQQDKKWNGCFNVKWHIVKDIPNRQFRHIVLENNDNDPVTNSRDTQEVKFKQGIEMLNIFKQYSHKTSLLDDFEYYDSRQKSMEEKRHVEDGSLNNIMQVHKAPQKGSGKNEIVVDDDHPNCEKNEGIAKTDDIEKDAVKPSLQKTTWTKILSNGKDEVLRNTQDCNSMSCK